MKRTLCLALAAVLAVGCGPSEKEKKAEEERLRKERAIEAQKKIKVNVPEPDHLLVKSELTVRVQRPSVVVAKVSRDGIIESKRLVFEGDKLRVTEKGGAQASSGCCAEGDPADLRALAGAMMNLAGSVKRAEGDYCHEPIVVDGDHKAQWRHLRTVLEAMSRAKMTWVLFATSAADDSLSGVSAKLPPGWKDTDGVPASAKKVDVDGKGQELTLTVDGKSYADVKSAADALRASGVKELAIHPVDGKTPLWAIVKAVELSNQVAPSGPVRFVLVEN